MLQIKNLYKTYDAGMIKALNNVTLNIAKGEICSIMGPSGCGKTTLLNILGALDKPTSGKVIINGTPLESLSSQKYRNEKVGIIFQMHNLLANMSLLENVELPLLAVKKVSSKQRRERAMEVLSEFGLEHRADFLPVQVSGGERQRTAIARALINRPEILLADEPTGSVDSNTSDLIMASILRRCEQFNMTAIIVTHNPKIAKFCPRNILMQDGEII